MMENHTYSVHESSFIDGNVRIGAGTKINYFCHIQSGAVIGENCILGDNVNISNNVKIGKECEIQNNVSLYEGVILEDYVFCGVSATFTNDLTPRSRFPKGKANYVKTILKVGASIGANATIVCGNTIGEWAIVAAGAVVVNDVLPHALVAGIPAKQVGWACQCGGILRNGICMECGEKYTFED